MAIWPPSKKEFNHSVSSGESLFKMCLHGGRVNRVDVFQADHTARKHMLYSGSNGRIAKKWEYFHQNIESEWKWIKGQGRYQFPWYETVRTYIVSMSHFPNIMHTVGSPDKMKMINMLLIYFICLLQLTVIVVNAAGNRAMCKDR